MITRRQWDEMTPQQQWDYVCLLEAIADETEADRSDANTAGDTSDVEP